MMLILSGKFAESLYLDKTMIVSEAELRNMKLTHDNIEIKSLIGNKAVIKFDIPECDAIGKSQPIYLSTLIYDYAHMYMNENTYTKIPYENLIMTDTDSCKMRHEDFLFWQEQMKDKHVPHWEEVEKYDERYKTSLMYAKTNRDKVIGSFADEYADKKYEYGFFLQKKGYMMGGENDNDMTFKGIKKDDVYLKNVNIEEIKKMSEKDLNDFYHTFQKIKDDYYSFFNDLYTNKTVTVLCQSLTKDKNKVLITSRTYLKTIII
jgi:hypothetical protein